MKQYKSYKEVYETFQKKEFTECIFKEISDIQFGLSCLDNSDFDPFKAYQVPPESFEEVCKAMANACETEQESFSWQLGGDVFICENEEDLKEIEGTNITDGEAFYSNVTQGICGFDNVNYVNSDSSCGWAEFFLGTNNAGGNVYYVPEALWTASNLEANLKANNPSVLEIHNADN